MSFRLFCQNVSAARLPLHTFLRNLILATFMKNLCRKSNFVHSPHKTSLTVPADLSRFRYWLRRTFVTTALLCVTRYSRISDSDLHLNNNTEDVFFSLQQWLRERATVSRFTNDTCLVVVLRLVHI